MSFRGAEKLTSFSSTVIGHPVPILAYRSWQKAIQNVLLRSSCCAMSVSASLPSDSTHRPQTVVETTVSNGKSSKIKAAIEAYSFNPVFRRWEALLDIQACTILSMESHHLSRPRGSPHTHPSPWEVHHFELVRAQQ